MKKLIIPFLLIAILLAYFHQARLSHGQLHVHFLDIGQGDSILIQTPSNKLILIDGGPGTEILTQLNDVLPFLQKKIDLMILTHPHSDHIEGLVPVLDRYQVETALITGVAYHNSYYEEFLHDLQNEAQIYYAHEGADFDFGDGVFLDVLYPFQPVIGEYFENINNSSIVARITYEDDSILLAGDAENEVEEALLESGVVLDSDLFKASHHGSKTANSKEFSEAVSPETVVIQVGEGNSFGHPHQETLSALEEMGATVYRNDLDGRVEVVY
ncbi:MAG: ComEC/Rec2 family competence protein [Patescibacteria group bacterium]|nr:MBL fold metallo-hydrolase [Patescibacteria group bacterium]